MPWSGAYRSPARRSSASAHRRPRAIGGGRALARKPPRPAAHGALDPVEKAAALCVAVRLPEQRVFPLRQTERCRERAHAGREHDEPGSKARAPRIDLGKYGRHQFEDECAKCAPQTLMQRPARRGRNGRERARQNQQRNRRDDQPDPELQEAPAQNQLGTPEADDDHAENGGEADRLQEEVGDDGAERPHPVSGCTTCGMREARVLGRPGHQAQPASSRQHRERQAHDSRNAASQPLFQRMWKQRPGLITGAMQRHVPTLFYASTETMRWSASRTVATS